MLKSSVVLLSLLLLSMGGCASQDVAPVLPHAVAVPSPALIPEPESLRPMPGSFVLTDGVRLVVPALDPAARAAAERFADLMRRTRGLSVEIAQGGEGDIILTRTPAARAEAYALSVTPSGVSISAGDDAGLQYGLITLWQLATLTKAGPAPIAAMDITDAPRFAWRGVMLDSARHYQSPAFIKGFIDWMALHKLNVFHWHLTDDQAWRLEIRSHPRLTEIGAWRVPEGAAAEADIDPETGRPRLYGGFYSQAEVREIVAYAAARGITVVPEIDVPGHASAAVAAYPELGVRDAPGSGVPAVPSDWGVYHTLFNTDEATIRFLQDVLDEVMDLFPGLYIHLGGDEAVKDQWKASPSTQARMRELGIANEAALQGWFMGRMEQHLNQNGRRLIGWDEILEGGLAGNAAVMSWRGIDGAIEAARLGHDTVLTPAPTFYLDNRQSPNDGAPGRGAVVSLQDLYTFDPIPPALTPAQAAHVLGVQANLWTEHMLGEDRVEYMAFPRLAALAELAWSKPARTDFDDFKRRLPTQLARYRSLGIDYAPAALDTVRQAPPANGARRYDHQMALCTEGLVLTLIDDAPVRGERAAFTLDIMNPCWTYQSADLSTGVTLEAAVGQVPFNFQIGADREKVHVRAAAPGAEALEVRIDGCEGPTVLVVPLTTARRSDGVTVVRGELPPLVGSHDLCLTFAQPGIDPMWGIDWVRLTPLGAR